MKTVEIKIPENFKMICTFMNINPHDALQRFADIADMNSFYVYKKLPPELKFLMRCPKEAKDPVVDHLKSQMLKEVFQKRHFLNGLKGEQYEEALKQIHLKWYKRIKAYKRSLTTKPAVQQK